MDERERRKYCLDKTRAGVVKILLGREDLNPTNQRTRAEHYGNMLLDISVR